MSFYTAYNVQKSNYEVFFWFCLFVKMTAMRCWHCSLMTTETLTQSDKGGKLKLLKILAILAISVFQEVNLKVLHHEATWFSDDLKFFAYNPQEWSLLPIAIKQGRPRIAPAIHNLCREERIWDHYTILLCCIDSIKYSKKVVISSFL